MENIVPTQYNLYQKAAAGRPVNKDLGPLLINFAKTELFTPFYARTKWKQFSADKTRLAAYNLKRFYIHIPYCKNSLCHYCKYSSVLLKNPEQLDTYTDYLVAYLRYFSTALKPIKFSMIYIGGGTPSILRADQLNRIISTARSCYDFSELTAFTCEMHPEHWSPEQVKVLKDGGCTRISMGVQSLKQSILKDTNRTQHEENVTRLIKCAREYGIPNVNADLILGLRNDTIASVLHGIKAMMKHKLETITIYTLDIENTLRGGYEKLGENHVRRLETLKKDFVPAVSPLAKEYGYRIYPNPMGFHIAKEEVIPVMGSFDRETEMARIEFGAGLHSISRIGNEMEYCDNAPDHRFAPGKKTLKGKEYSLDEQIAWYSIRNLRLYGYLDMEALHKRFGINPRKYFSAPLSLLRSLGRVRMEGNRIYFKERKRKARNGDILFLCDYVNGTIRKNVMEGRTL